MTLAIVAAGCQDNPTSPSSTIDSFSFDSALSTIGLDGAPESTTREKLNAIGKAEFELRDILSESETWPEAEAGFRAQIESADPLRRWALGQLGGLILFHGYLLDGEPTDDKGDLARYYLPFITNSHTPQVDVVYQAISIYKNEWHEEFRVSTAADAAAVGREYLQNKARCGDDCAPSPEQKETIINTPLADPTIQTSRIADAVRKLELMEIN